MKLNIRKISANNVSLNLEIDGVKKNYRVKIVDNHGLFGVEFPPELGLLMQQFPAETKHLVGELRKRVGSEQKFQAA